MKGMEARLAIGLALSLVAGLGCGSDRRSSAPARNGCVVGATAACACTDGRMGAQVCQSDRRFGPCACSGSPADGGPSDVGAAFDGGFTASDAGLAFDADSPRDAAPPRDGGPAPRDSGPAPRDSGPAPHDSGPPPRDSGPPPPRDSGVIDSGFVDSGVPNTPYDGPYTLTGSPAMQACGPLPGLFDPTGASVGVMGSQAQIRIETLATGNLLHLLMGSFSNGQFDVTGTGMDTTGFSHTYRFWGTITTAGSLTATLEDDIVLFGIPGCSLTWSVTGTRGP